MFEGKNLRNVKMLSSPGFLHGWPVKGLKIFPSRQNAFVFTVVTEAADTFQLPIYDGGTYAFNVSWGDGSSNGITAYDDAAANHSYAAAGTYTVRITGTINGWRFNNVGDKTLIHDISSWGPLLLGNNGSYFYGCSNLTVSATDILDVSSVTNFYYAFRACTSLTTMAVGAWNVSLITNFTSVFSECAALTTIDVGTWNVSSGTIFDWTFYGCTSLTTVAINNWDITAATNLSGMLIGVTLSTTNYSDILIAWEGQAVNNNVSFHGGNSKYSAGAAATARQALIDDHNWTITDGGQEKFVFTVVTEAADTFQLPLEASGTYAFNVNWDDGSSDDITAYDDAAANHSYAAAGTYTVRITGTINGWRFNNVGDKTLIHDISSWGPLLLGNNGSYFYGCSNLTVSATDILDVSSVTNFYYAFRACTSLTTMAVGAWNVSLITNFTSVFSECAALTTIDVGTWNVSSGTIFDWTFYGCTSLTTVAINNWDITAATNLSGMLIGVTLSTTNYSDILIAWEGQAVNNNVSFHGGNSKYSAGAAATARQALIDDHNWTITDGGQAP